MRLSAALQKQNIRKTMLARRRALSSEETAVMRKALTERLLSLPLYRKARRIMAYLSMKGEADGDLFIQKAQQDGKEVYVPYLLDREGHMEAALLEDMNALERGPMGLRKVPEDHRTAAPEDMDLVLVPAVAFDEKGYRIGMGKGYYDRYLVLVPEEKRAGIVWDFQILPEVPAESFDEAVPVIVTEKRILSAKRE